VILEGFDFERASMEDVEALCQLAIDFNVELWMSAVRHRDLPVDGHGIPEPLSKFADEISVIVQMKDDAGGVQLSILKDHDNPEVTKVSLALDPATMLLVRK
jgi:hypothetical protein